MQKAACFLFASGPLPTFFQETYITDSGFLLEAGLAPTRGVQDHDSGFHPHHMYRQNAASSSRARYFIIYDMRSQPALLCFAGLFFFGLCRLGSSIELQLLFP